MTKKPTKKDKETAVEAPDEAIDPRKAKNTSVVVHAQYVKDISFENPNAPKTLKANQARPQMDININLDAKPLEDENIQGLYEVAIMMTATAKNDEMTFFVAEITYGILASLNEVPESQHHPILLIEVPKLGFPYVRQILSSLTAQGGYPPLLVNPVDFESMYMEQFGKEQGAADAGDKAEPQGDGADKDDD